MDAATAQRIGIQPTGQGFLSEILDTREPLLVEDISRHPSSTGFPPGHPGMNNFLGVAIRYRGKALGNLYLAEKDGGFSLDDAQVVSLFADQAGVALENARLFTEAESHGRP